MWEQTKRHLEKTLVESRSKGFRRRTLKTLERFCFGVEEFTYAQYAEFIVYMIKERGANRGYIDRVLKDVSFYSPLSDGVSPMISAVMRSNVREYTIEEAERYLSVINDIYYRAAVALLIVGITSSIKQLLKARIYEYDKKEKTLGGKKISAFTAKYVEEIINTSIEYGMDKTDFLFMRPEEMRHANNITGFMDAGILRARMKRAQKETGLMFYDRFVSLKRAVVPSGLIRYGKIK